MTPAEFNSQIIRLKEVYGPDRYKQERMAMLWREIQDLPLEYFRVAVDTLIMSKAHAPMPSDFMEILRPAINQLAEEKKRAALKSLPDCFTCDNSGVEFATEIETGHRYAYQCTCARGKLLVPAYPVLTGRVNPRSDNLSAEEIEKIKAFINDPRATIFRRQA